MNDKRSLAQHWLVLCLGVVVLTIFLTVMFFFTVKENEVAIVMRFGKPVTENGVVKVCRPGLNFRIPYPVETVWKHDKRIHSFELSKGQVEQQQTADSYQIIVSTFVLWKVGDPALYMTSTNNKDKAESVLNDLVRSSRNQVIGQHKLSEYVNVDPAKVKIAEIEAEILGGLKKLAMEKYGIEVTYLGFKHIGFPEAVTQKVFERMKAERGRKSEKFRADGQRDATIIRSEANTEVSNMITDAEATAKQIRADGDKAAAEYYSVFRENPQLASFLRKLDSLRKTVDKKTTLILDTNTPPFDVLKTDALDFSEIDSKQDKEGTK